MKQITLSADFEKLRVMLDNLLSNAIKYSPPGGAIALSARENGSEIVIDVTDEGPGIAAHERALVFEPFYRGQHASDTLVKGTGIGLSVVREYAQMHGGSVEAIESDAGAHIRVTLPGMRQQAVAAPAELPETQAVK